MAKARRALCCPACRADLFDTAGSLRCSSCSAEYPVRGGKIYFIDVPEATDELDIVKYRLKKALGKFYYAWGITIFAPTFPFNYRAAVLRLADPDKQLVVDIGAGNHRIDPRILTIDLFDYAATDIVCDLSNLPFRDESVDAFISRSVLEHVPGLSEICKHLARATRKGGLAAHLIPFMFPFHASPHDYQRLTHVGAANLFPGFELLEQRNATGPFTLLTLLLIEVLAATFSLGSERLKALLYLVFCLFFFPIKFLDFAFVGRSSMLRVAPTIFTVTRKTKHVEVT
ncbi:methyltransferase domain-containing protein [Bradyrhizobium sp. 62]|uniref:methyltransferase domain-containing protein n=1 Tax=Bradyrhizobium sp. 62 TaxID=1043588 RepID=UPI001FFA1523|nr:methyltransferase domain-containing protein [Bradyrhizobium sp. 62]MCK1364137.1 methyltransferase domain-containing protein [Bradyrhizobium sp. 62]